MRLLKHLSPREESMLYVIKVRSSPAMASDVEYNREMEASSSIGVLGVILIGVLPCCLPGCCV